VPLLLATWWIFYLLVVDPVHSELRYMSGDATYARLVAAGLLEAPHATAPLGGVHVNPPLRAPTAAELLDSPSLQLLYKHRPVVFFDPAEIYFADTVPHYLAAASLLREDTDELLASGGGGGVGQLSPSALLAAQRTALGAAATLPVSPRRDIIDATVYDTRIVAAKSTRRGLGIGGNDVASDFAAVSKRLFDVPLYGDVRKRTMCSGDGGDGGGGGVSTCVDKQDVYELLYIFFESYNGATHTPLSFLEMGAHDADIEHMTIRIDAATMEVMSIYLGAHQYTEGQWHEPSHLAFLNSTHPVVYASRGSHATYARAGVLQRSRSWFFPHEHTGAGAVWYADLVIPMMRGTKYWPLNYNNTMTRYLGLWGQAIHWYKSSKTQVRAPVRQTWMWEEEPG
jgi:hypothetical protein